MLIKVNSEKTVREAADALEAAVLANRYGVMHVHDLKETLNRKGVDFDRECMVFEVCQPLQAKKVLERNMNVSTALPCRISVYEEDGETILAALKPTALLALFDTPELAETAKEVESAMIKIMNEAAAA